MLDLQMNLFCPLCYNSRAHCSLLQCLCILSDMLADTHSYFVRSLNVREKNSFHDLIFNPSTFHHYYYKTFILPDFSAQQFYTMTLLQVFWKNQYDWLYWFAIMSELTNKNKLLVILSNGYSLTRASTGTLSRDMPRNRKFRHYKSSK